MNSRTPQPIWETDVFQVRQWLSSFPTKDKLLATAGHPLTAKLHALRPRKCPPGTVAWAHPRGDTYTPQALKTTYVSLAALTPVNQEDQQNVTVTYTPTDTRWPPSSDGHPLNITAPRLFTSVPKNDGIIAAATRTTGWINSNDLKREVWLLKRTYVHYFLFDQFADRITESDRGTKPNRKDIKKKELVHWSGPRQDANNWANNNVPYVKDWKKHNAFLLSDGLNPPKFPVRIFLDPQTIPTPQNPDRKPRFNLANVTELIAVKHHGVQTSVDEKVPTIATFTDNELSVKVKYRLLPNKDHDQIMLTTTYKLKVTMRKPD